MKKRICAVVTLVLLAAFCIPAGFSAAEETVVFSDPVLETRVRQAIGVPEGEITLETAKEITGLDLAADENAPESERIHNIEALLYFPNLEYLNLDNNRIEDVGILLDLKNLKDLSVYGNPIGKLPKLGIMTGLERLCFDAQLNDISFVTGLTNLTELIATGVRSLPDTLPELTRLNALCVPGGELEDISIVAQLPNLHALDISWNLVSDLSALEGMPLTELYIEGNPIENYEPVRDIVPNLIGTNVDFDEIFVDLTEPDDPGLVIVFQDALLERCVRDALQKPDGEITAGDAATVIGLYHGNEWYAEEDERIHDLTGIRYFINLRHLDLCFNDVGDITELAGLTKLKDLNIGGNHVPDISVLAGMTEMQSLSIFGNGITDISALENMPNLFFLNADNNPIADFTPLAGLTQMDMLDLSNCGLRDIAVLGGLERLMGLDIADNEIADISVLASMPNLQKLFLDRNPIADYSPVSAIYPNLMERDFEYWEGRSDALLEPENPQEVVWIPDPILQLAVRKSLNRPEGELTAGDLAAITRLEWDNEWQPQIPQELAIRDLTGMEYCINLRTLSLCCHAISDLTPLRGLHKLVVLRLGSNQIADLGALQDMTMMQELRIFGNRIADLSPLMGMINLHTLQLDNNSITDLSPLAALPGLNSLSVCSNCIADLSPLAGFANLRELYLKGNPIADASAMQAIYGNLHERDFVYGLWFEEDESSQDAGEAVMIPDPLLQSAIREIIGKPEGEIYANELMGIEWLPLGSDWQEERLEGSRIADLTGLEACENLKGLELQNADVHDLSPLQGLQKLELLNLLNNGITDIGPLGQIQSLQWVELRQNAITDFSPLAGLGNLYGLLITDNPGTDYTPLADIYPNLTEKDFELP